MKIFISADLEGVNGVMLPEDIEDGMSGYQQAREFMTEEVNAVIEGAFEAGATEVLVCDSHDISANIMFEKLDKRALLTRGDTRMNSMANGLDESFDAVILTGYHAKFGTQNAILDHSFDPRSVRDIKVNGVSVGEMGFNTLFAWEKGVPVVMVTGDAAIGKEVNEFCEDIDTAVVKYAEGRFSARCLPREVTQKLLKDTAKHAVETISEKKKQIEKLPKTFAMEITFQQVNLADGAMRVPGLKRVGPMAVEVSAGSMAELMNLRQVISNSALGFYNANF